MRRIYFLPFLMLLGFSYVFGQWNPNTDENLLISSPSGWDSYSYTTSTGKTFVTYNENDSGWFYFKGQFLDENGNKLWDKKGVLLCDSAIGQGTNKYSGVIDNKDELVYCGQFVNSQKISQLFINKIDQNGIRQWGSSGRILGSYVGSSLAVNKNNEIYIFSSGYLWKISENGQNGWKSYIELGHGSKIIQAQILPLNDGGAIVVYHEQDTAFPPAYGILFAERINSNGSKAWQNPVQLFSGRNRFFSPSPALIINDTVFIAYNNADGSQPYFYSYLQKLIPSGEIQFGKDGKRIDKSDDISEIVSMKFNQFNDRLYFILKTYDQTQNNPGIKLQSMDRRGNYLLTENAKELFSTESNSEAAENCLEIIGNGIAFPFVQGNSTVKMAVCDVNGNIISTTNLATSPYGKSDPSLGLFKNNQLVFVFSEGKLDPNNAETYAQNFKINLLSVNDNVDFQNSISVYPNPASEKVTITLPFYNSHTNIRILDLIGLEVLNQTNNLDLTTISWDVSKIPNTLQIDVSRLVSGIYFIKAESNGKLFFKSIQIRK